MKKVKLSREQIDAIDQALSHLGDVDRFIKMHLQMVREGHEWKWAALNDVTPRDLARALKFGYEEGQPNNSWSVERLEKYGEDFKADMLEFLEDTSYRERLATFKIHKEKLAEGLLWAGYQTFNKLSIRQMGDALGIDKATIDNSPTKILVFQEKSSLEELEVDLDYFLASLQHAKNNDDTAGVERSKQRLMEIQREMAGEFP